jgi:hypothetical protein
MDDSWTRFWQEIAARPTGPMALRFYLQPAMAMLFALRDGVHDARANKPAYFWSLLTNSADRRELIRHGWKSVGKIFLVSVILDTIYQLFVLHGLRPLQTLVVATLLAIIPYVVLRGPVNRIARSMQRGNQSGPRRAA